VPRFRTSIVIYSLVVIGTYLVVIGIHRFRKMKRSASGRGDGTSEIELKPTRKAAKLTEANLLSFDSMPREIKCMVDSILVDML